MRWPRQFRWNRDGLTPDDNFDDALKNMKLAIAFLVIGLACQVVALVLRVVG